MAKKRKKSTKGIMDSLVGRTQRIGRISEPHHGSNLPGGKSGVWAPGDPIPAKLTTKEQKYIGKKRHEAALKKYKKRKKGGK